MKQLLLLLFLLPIVMLGAQNPNFSPANPKPGDLVRMEIDLSNSKLRTANSIDLVVLEYANGKAAITEAATTRSGNKLIGFFTLGPDALSAVASLLEGDDNWDNNGGEGYFVPVHDSNGKPNAEGKIGAAILYRDYGGIMSLNRTPSVAFDLINQAIEAQPDLKRKHFGVYINVLMAIKRGAAGKPEAITLLEQVETDPTVTDEELTAISRFYERNGEVPKAKELQEKIRARFPKGEMVKLEKRRAIQNEPDLVKAEEMLSTFISQFPPESDNDKQALNALRANLASKIADSGDWPRFRTLAMQLPEADRFNAYNNLAWELAEKGENLEEARILAANATEWARKEIESPTATKPPYRTHKQWAEGRKNTFATFGDTYAYILGKSGDALGAAAIQAEVVEMTEGKSTEMNERFTNYLEASASPELRYRLEGFILSGHANTKMKEQFKKRFVAEDKTEAGAVAYLGKLEANARASRQKDLLKKMVKEPAVPFKLLNLEGKPVSLESLRGKVVVVDFWATWCGPCKASFPGMQLAVNQYKNDENVAFVFIDSWERAVDKTKNAADFMASKGYTFNVLMDTDDQVIAAYGVSGIPTKYILDRQGNIRFKTVGFEGSDEGLAEELSLMIEVARSQP